MKFAEARKAKEAGARNSKVDLQREFKTLALKLQEVSQPLSQTDIARALNDCLRDMEPSSYCYVCDIFGDADSGDVVYSCGGEYYKAPYEMGTANGKRTCTIDSEKALDVVPRTIYDEEADEEDHVAGMSEEERAEKYVERFPGSTEWRAPFSERFISKDERDSADSGDFAGGGRSFPILRPGDVMAAVRSIGRGVAGGQSATTLKNKIKSIAKRKGWEKYLPKAWQGDDTESSTWKPEGELLVESAHFLDEPKLQEAAATAYPIKLISPGRGSSGYYSEGVLRKAAEAKVFKAGTQMFWNHDTDAEEGARPEGDLNRLAAVTTTDAAWDESGRDGPGLYAQAKVFSDYSDQVKEKGPHIGLSIRAGGSRDNEAKGPDGRAGVITALHNAMSVDFVTRAGRDGKIFTEAAITSDFKEEKDMDKSEIQALLKEALAPIETKLTATEAENKRLRAQLSRQQAPSLIREALKDIRLPEASKNKIVKRLAESELPDDAKALNELIESEARSEAQFLQELGYGNIEAIGARMTEAEMRKQGEEGEKEHKEAFAKSQESLCNMFIGAKLRTGSDDAKALRDEAREAFMEGRAA